MTKMLESLVAKLLPVLSLTCTTSKEPGCLSRLVMTPIRPKLAPPVTMHRLPTHRKRVSTCVTQVEHQCILKLCGFYRKSSHQIILTVITVQVSIGYLYRYCLAAAPWGGFREKQNSCTDRCQTWWILWFCQSPGQCEPCRWPWSWDQGSVWCEHRGSPGEGFP